MNEVSRQLFTTESVEERQSGGEGWNRDAPLDGGSDGLTPRVLAIVDGVLEEVVQQQVAEVRVLVEGCFDVSQEHTETEPYQKQNWLY